MGSFKSELKILDPNQDPSTFKKSEKVFQTVGRWVRYPTVPVYGTGTFFILDVLPEKFPLTEAVCSGTMVICHRHYRVFSSV